jgi:signal transduction histidine kinase
MVIIALLMISTLAIGFVIHATIHEAAFGGGFRFGKINPVEVLAEVRYQLILRVSCILFATLVVIGIFGVFFLHRIAGPVYRFRQLFLKINRGEIPSPIRLREEDFFNETAEEINRLVERLQLEAGHKKAIREKVDQILAQYPGEHVAGLIRELRSAL